MKQLARLKGLHIFQEAGDNVIKAHERQGVVDLSEFWTSGRACQIRTVPGQQGWIARVRRKFQFKIPITKPRCRAARLAFKDALLRKNLPTCLCSGAGRSPHAEAVFSLHALREPKFQANAERCLLLIRGVANLLSAAAFLQSVR